MIKHSKIFFTCIALSLVVSTTNAQEVAVTNDIGSWLTAGFEKKLYKGFKLEFEQELRLFKNFTKIDDIISNIEFSYKINKNFSIAAGGRYTYDMDYLNNFQHDLRYNLDFSYQIKLSSVIRLGYRLRYQNEYLNCFRSREIDNLQEIKFRNRIKLEYYHKQANKFYFSAEIFRLHKIFRLPYFSNIRLFIGDKYSFGKHSLDISLGFQHFLKKESPAKLGVLSLKYSFN